MKKILSITGLMLTALSLIQCTDDNIDKIGMELTSQPKLHVEYTPMTDGSRTTTNPDGTVEWDAQDQLNVFVVEHGKQPQQINDWQKYSYKYITDSKNCKEGIFTPDPNMKQPIFYQGYSYDWYVLSPYNSNIKDPIGGADSQTSFEIGNQTQEYDQPMKHLVKSDILTAITTNVIAGDNPNLHLHHKGTLMKFTIQNNEKSPLTLRSINFSTSPDICIAGKFSIDFKEDGILEPIEKQNTLNIAIRNAKPLEIGQTYDVYAIMSPFTLDSGDEFSISILSDLGIMTQTKKIKNNKSFLPGKINSAIVTIRDSKPDDGQIVIPDKNFERYLLNKFDVNKDGRLLPNEAEDITSINVNSKNIQSLKGIEYMTQLGELRCAYNSLQELDLSNNTYIHTLDCSHNKINNLNIQENIFLRDLTCNYNQLDSLNISTNYELYNLTCHDNPNLFIIYVWDGFNEQNHNHFHKDEFTKYIWLKDDSDPISVTDINFEKCLLYSFDRNQDGILSIKEAQSITDLNCSSREITTLKGIEKCINLRYLDCDRNKIKELDLKNNQKLSTLSCSDNNLKTLDVSMNENLYFLDCSHNDIDSLNIQNNTRIWNLDCSNNRLKHLDVSKNTKLTDLFCYSNKLKIVFVPNTFKCNDFSNYKTHKEILFLSKDTPLNFDGERVSFPEKKFHEYLLEHYDLNNDQQLTTGECDFIRYIEIAAPRIIDHEEEPIIETATGLENLTNIEYLDFSGPTMTMTGHPVDIGIGGLKTLDVSKNKKLKYIDCEYNKDLKELQVWKGFNANNLVYFNIPYNTTVSYK